MSDPVQHNYCNECGRTYLVKHHLVTGGCRKAYFCSHECHLSYGVHRTAEELPAFCEVEFRLCVQCGAGFDATRYRAKKRETCSAECRKRLKWREKHPDAGGGRRRCKRCGLVFEYENTTKKPRFCSEDCRMRSARGTRANRMKGAVVESVDPMEVFRRDRWTCQLCGVKTLKSKRGTVDPRAPELDHIVPISKGGEHSYRNTQCLCRKCNGAKSARPKGQLRLCA